MQMPLSMPRHAGAGEEDRAVVQKILEGEVDAFALLMTRYQDYVLAIVKRLHGPWRPDDDA